MRITGLLLAFLALPTLVFAAESKPAPATKSEAPKPAVRTVQVKDGFILFNVRLTPGVPDPGQVVEAKVEMFEVPPVPDPIYGEQIPIKDAVVTASITDADGEGYTQRYLIHPLMDAGTYGFHFTPSRKDIFRVTFTGTHKGRKYSAGFRTPVAVWPFKDRSAKKNNGPASPGSRLPALPTGMKGPAGPASPGAARTPAGAKTAASGPALPPMTDAMQRMGDKWVVMQLALFAGRAADMNRAKTSATSLQQVSTVAASIQTDISDFAPEMKELAKAFESMGAAAGAGKREQVKTHFGQIADKRCTRCHLVYRWKVLGSLAEYPKMLH